MQRNLNIFTDNMNDLELVIKHLKEEIEGLSLQLKNCLSDFDYQGAHLFQTALYHKRIEVDTITKRLQSNNREIVTLKRKVHFANKKIENYKEQLAKHSKNEKRKEYIVKQLEFYTDELNEFSNNIISLHKSRKLLHIDNDLLINTVEHLIANNFNSICLEIKEHDLYFISVFNVGESMEIEFVKASIIARNRVISTHQKGFLNKLGFSRSDFDNWNLVLNRKITDPEKIIHILSSLSFDVIQTTSNATCNLMIQKNPAANTV